MARKLLCFIALVYAAIIYADAATFMAGVAKIDATLPDESGIGVPLAGYNHGTRRYSLWPIPQTGEKYCNWMMPSQGRWNPTWAKAVVMQDPDGTMFAILTIDAIGMAGSLADLAFDIAAAMGLRVPRENIIMSGSHTHSGPGSVAPDFLWAIAPATDLMNDSLQRKLATNAALALIQAQNSMTNATIALGQGYLVGVTENRRASISPYVTRGTIDPHLGVIRLDRADGSVLATVWNYATHGTCFGPENMKFSSDIMGYTCDVLEDMIGGTALFINGDAGDIDPTGAACLGIPKSAGSHVIAAAIVKERAKLVPTTDVKIRVASQLVSFGLTNGNITLERFENCTSGGPLDICSICKILDCDINLHLNEAWLENTPRFTAATFEIRGNTTLLVTMPGEPLVELGWQVYNDTKDLGFDTTFLCGYSNNHMGYFATPNEYDIGGYESQLTMWGRYTAEMVRAGARSVAAMVAPKKKTATINPAQQQQQKHQESSQE